MSNVHRSRRTRCKSHNNSFLPDVGQLRQTLTNLTLRNNILQLFKFFFLLNQTQLINLSNNFGNNLPKLFHLFFFQTLRKKPRNNRTLIRLPAIMHRVLQSIRPSLFLHIRFFHNILSKGDFIFLMEA